MKSSLSSRWIPPPPMTELVGSEPSIPPLPALPPEQAHAPVEVPEHNHAGTRDTANRPGFAWIFVGLLAVSGLLASLFYFGWKPKEHLQTVLASASDEVKNAPLRVSVIAPKKSDAMINLLLPGEVQAERETGIYARTSGYVKTWTADIGDHVKAGQLLADIDSPEVDMQLEQSKAA